MKILALEFSTNQRSAAVIAASGSSHQPVVTQTIQTGAQSLNSLDLIEKTLQTAGIDRDEIECLAVGIGPGSYTGIRGAIALAQGWQLARSVNLLGISSARCIATQAQAEGVTGTINVVIDAQRGEFYLQAFSLTQATDLDQSQLRIATFEELRKCEQADEILVGPQATHWFLKARTVFPQAATLARLALSRTDFIAGEKLEPIYLRETSFVKAPPARHFFE